jgi:catechol 2,3-dioxygenase-like lactoylglutathione lyase family enzyme
MAAVTRSCLGPLVVAAVVSGVVLVQAQAPAAPAPGSGLVVGSGNFFSPIVANLERAVAFYRDGLGLDVTGTPSNAADNAPLRNMFGLPDAQLRWTIARPAGSRNGVEIIEISKAGSRPLNRRITDPGAMTLVTSTPDVDQAVRRLQEHGGTRLGSEAKTNANATGTRVAVVRDPDDHFVALIASPPAAGPLPPRIRLTVQDLPRAIALYGGALGLRAITEPRTQDMSLMNAIGLTSGGIQAAAFEVPGSGLAIEFVVFTGVRTRNVSGRIQDPGSTRLQLQVRDLDAAIKAVVTAGGQVVSTAGMPVELPGGRGGAIRAAIVRDPDNLFVVLIQAG